MNKKKLEEYLETQRQALIQDLRSKVGNRPHMSDPGFARFALAAERQIEAENNEKYGLHRLVTNDLKFTKPDEHKYSQQDQKYLANDWRVSDYPSTTNKDDSWRKTKKVSRPVVYQDSERRAFPGIIYEEPIRLKEAILAVNKDIERIRSYKGGQSHFDRNYYNRIPSTIGVARAAGWRPEEDKDNIYHSFNDNDYRNVKYLSPDGHHEVIFDKEGKLVIKPSNIGTFNFSSPSDGVNHFYYDMVPYFREGNAENDPTTRVQRILKTKDFIF